jgi:fumarate reductase flavoprotein subunit
LKRTLGVWRNEQDTLPTLTYEAIDVMTMELPPGFRGYGAKNCIEHPDTAQRVAQVEQLKVALQSADRFTLQTALMQYDHLLPRKYQGKNERLGEQLP